MRLVAKHALRVAALAAFAAAAGHASAQMADPMDSSLNPPPPVAGPDRVTFFPTPTPVFGAPISDRVTKFVTVRRQGREITFPAPEDLADHVNEWFYAALGTRISEKRLHEPLAQRLTAYRAHRYALANELWNELATVQPAEPAARERQLREFARMQTPRIAALEDEAESLREAMVAVDGFFGWGADWNAEREWKLGSPLPGGLFVPPRGPSLAETTEFLVIRAAAYFQNGLGVEQRGLLREIALTEQEKMLVTPSPRQRGGDDPLVVFFSPETARLSLPPGLSPDLRTKIGSYNGDKDALKRELRDAIVDLDKSSDARRTKALRELTERQWPRLVALEKLAEEIRQGLAALPPPPLPALPPALPAGLKERIEVYLRERQALEQEHAKSQRAAFAKLLQSGSRRSDIVFRDDGSFRLENAERYEALAADLKSISHDLTVFAHTQIDPETSQPMDPRILLRRIDASDRAFDKIGREEAVYHDYRTAMLEPGLSAEQRRLLFGRAVVELAQPLTAGSKMPNGPLMNPVRALF